MAALAEGTRAVQLAREAVEHGLAHRGASDDAAAPFRGLMLPDWFDELRGVFVTFTQARSGRLRGCIGFPLPIFPLRLAIPRAAWAAASEDPRFPPISPSELPGLRIELSVLTRPERLPKGPFLVESVRVGTDGLIVEGDGTSGLLLPQVAAEEGWDAARFLSETCRKAGLPPSAWQRDGTTVRRFQAELFREVAPGGPVESHALAAAGR
jgi:uncharacterized protein